MGRLSKPRRILITGASQGIGRATALALARAGHRIVLAARREPALKSVAHEIEQLGAQAEIAVLDLQDTASVERAMAEVLDRGPVDVLINNAGHVAQREFLHQDPALLDVEFDVNYFGMQRMIRAWLPSAIRHGEGSIVNVSSLLGSVGAPTTANYGASKAALESFSHALRGEVDRFGIAVTVFVAPHTKTEMGKHTEFRGVTSLPVDYVAKELVRAVDSRPRRYAASPVYRLLLRLASWFPEFMEARLVASVKHLLSPPPQLPRARSFQQGASGSPATDP